MAMSGASPNHSPKPGVSSPWSQIVAAAPPSSSPPPPPVVDAVSVNSPPPEDSDNGGGSNANTGKRAAWIKPSNAACSSVMGADSWPLPSESARAPVKSPSPSLSPSELAKASTDTSSVPSPLQDSGSVTPSPHRNVRDNANANNNNNNNTGQTHQKSFKRSNSITYSNGGHHPPQMAGPQGPIAPAGSHNYNSAPKEHQPRAGFLPNDHPPQRNSFRHRNGGGPHQRGDGHHHHNNYGGRRDQDPGNQDWNNHRNFNGRDFMSPRYGPRFIRPPPPPNATQLFPPPPPLRPFGGSIGFPELPPQMVYIPPPPLESMRGVPFVSPIPPNAMFFQPLDNQLHTKIVDQIDYYFSNDNLIKDIYLRRNMDDQGWVPINLIAGFKKIKYLTDNIQIVLDAVRTSSVVEVQGDKIRRRNDWRRWIMPAGLVPNVRGSQTVGQLAEQVQNIALETTINDNAGILDDSQNRPFGDLNSQYLLSTSEGTAQVGIQVSDHSISARN